MSALHTPKLVLVSGILITAVAFHVVTSRQVSGEASQGGQGSEASAPEARDVAEDRLRAAWDSLTRAEREFAAQSIEEGKIEALLNHFADDAVVFHRDGPAHALTVYRASGSAGDTAQLISRAHYTDVSLAGDLGLTAGPYQHLSNNTDSGDRTQGHIVAVWRRVEGRWRLAADIAVRIPGVLSLDVEPDFEDTRLVLEESSLGGGVDGSLETLREADSRFARSVSFQGGRRAMNRFGLEHQRVYLPGMAPAIGVAAGGQVYESFLDERLAMDTIAINTLGGLVSASGEVGYTYGTMVAENSSFNTSYLRFWRISSDGEWKIAVEVLNPFIPAEPASVQGSLIAR